VRIPPGLKHWHGASPTAAMTHIAVQEEIDGTNVNWMEKVSDELYGNQPSSSQGAKGPRRCPPSRLPRRCSRSSDEQYWTVWDRLVPRKIVRRCCKMGVKYVKFQQTVLLRTEALCQTTIPNRVRQIPLAANFS
jgi:hypothetical protein